MLKARGEQPQLSEALLELAFQKVLADEDSLESFRNDFAACRTKRDGSDKVLADLSDPAMLELLVAELRKRRSAGPQNVTDRLRPYRLAHEVQYSALEGLDRRTVDQVLQYGAACAPVLIGVLRGWSHGDLPPEDDLPAEASLALLGEIGDPAFLPAVLEFLQAEEDWVREAAQWAVGRMAEKHPQQTSAAIREAGKDATPEFRCCLAEMLSMLPDLEGLRDTLFGLLDGLERVKNKKLREVLFLLVTSAILETQGSGARAMVLALIARFSPVLSKKTRELSLAPAAAPEAIAGPPRPSIYEMCTPPAEDEDFEEPLEAVRRPRPQRNEPCWCGSGKKYKKCHLLLDEEAERRPAEAPAPELAASAADPKSIENRLRRRLVAFVERELSKRELADAISECFGRSLPFDAEPSSMVLMDWLIHDHALPRFGRPAIVEFLERNRSNLTAQECRLLEQWSGSRFSLFEVERIEPGAGIEVRDLLIGDSFFVHDVSSSNTLVRWDCILSRVIDCETRKEFSADGLLVPLSIRERLLDWIGHSKSHSRLDWAEYLRANSHRLRRKVTELSEEWRDSIRFANAEGDALVFSKAVYEAADEPALVKSLEAFEVIQRNPSSGFDWFEEPAAGERPTRLLGGLRLKGRRLVLECNSRQRLARGRKMLEPLAPGILIHKRDEFTSAQAAIRKSGSAPAPPEKNPIPFEIQQQLLTKYKDKHYGQWPDTPLPALGGKTPREAMRTRGGREQVLTLVKLLENTEEHNRQAGEPWYDFSKLKASLGVEL
ncbi:MAG TPA: SEC-C metal-binding domain-containing protein [Bryobacterales bacterium]|nr:SEC-C metal-binding domain-containing protein [Bryobacterales bacterium]